jgi:antitoxin ParD1/3/4
VLLAFASFANRDRIDWPSVGGERGAAGPTRTVNLTDELDRFVAKKINAGRFGNASEIVRAGLRSLEREEGEYEANFTALRSAIHEGDASGVARGDVFRRVRKRLKLSAVSRQR